MIAHLLIGLFVLFCALCWWLVGDYGPAPRQGGPVRPEARREDDSVALSAAYAAVLSTQDTSSGCYDHAGAVPDPSCSVDASGGSGSCGC